jgi:hypothetical protein
VPDRTSEQSYGANASDQDKTTSDVPATSNPMSDGQRDGQNENSHHDGGEDPVMVKKRPGI